MRLAPGRGELLSIVEAEGADNVEIHKKCLKSGREVWTLGGPD